MFLQRAMAAFVLSTIADGNPKGQLACMQSSLLPVCMISIQDLLKNNRMQVYIMYHAYYAYH
jgi:hypothetical protein